MQTKMIEIRDSGTCIAALAIRMVADGDGMTEWRFLRREGYPADGSAIVLMRLSDQRATVDPYEWPSLTRGARTMPTAHDWITRHWDEIESGDVVDVQYILNFMRNIPINAPNIPLTQDRVKVIVTDEDHGDE